MAADTRIATTLLKWQVDTASIQSTIQSNKQIAASFTDIQDAAAQLGLDANQVADLNNQLGITAQNAGAAGQAYSQMAQAAVSSANTQSTAIKSVIRDLGDLGNDIKALPEPDLSAFGVDDPSGGGGNPISRSDARGLRYALSGIPGGSQVSQLASSVSYLGLAGGAVTALGLAAKALQDYSDAAAKSLTASADAFQKVVIASQNATSAQIRAQIDQAKQDLAVKQQLAQQASVNLYNYLHAHPEVAIPVVGITEENLGANGTQAGGLGGLQQASKDADKAFTDAQDNLNSLNIVLDSNSTAANNFKSFLKTLADDGFAIAQAAAKKLEEQQQQQLAANKASLDADASFYQQAAQLRRDGSSAQVDAILKANTDEQSIIQGLLIPSYNKLGLSTDDLNKRFQLLADQDKVLAQSVLPVIQAREAEAAATKAQLSIIQDSIGYQAQLAKETRSATVDQTNDQIQSLRDQQAALQTYLPQLEALAPTSADAAQALADAQFSLGRLSDDIQDQFQTVLPAAIGRALTQLNSDYLDHLTKLSSIQQDEQAQETADRAKTAAQLIQLDKQTNERILEQHEQNTLSIRDAESRGDFARVQAIIASQKIQDADTRRNAQDQKDQLQQQLDEQLKQEQAAAQKSIGAENARWNTQSKQEQDAINRAETDQRNYLASLQSTTTTAHRAAQSDEAAHQNRLGQIAYAGGQYLESVASDIWNALIARAQAAQAAIGSTTGSGGGSLGSGSPGFGYGQSLGAASGYFAGVPSMRSTVTGGQSSGAQVLISVGAGSDQLAQKVVSAINPVLDQHGEAVKVEVVQSLTARNKAAANRRRFA